MLKKFLGALGTSAAVFAAGNVSAGALGSPNEIFIGGATAVQETFHLDIMLRFCEYDGNANDGDGIITPQVFVDQVLTTPGNGDGSAALPTLRHNRNQVTHCTFKASLGAPMAGAEVAVYKFNGGSGTGVAPVADPAVAPSADQQFMDASTATCPQVIPTSNPGPGDTFVSADGATRFKLYDCPSTFVTQAPDGGISDVEPKVFVGQLATGFGTSVPGISPDKPQNDFVDKGNLNVKSGPGIVFGVIVTTAFYDELVNDQSAAGLLPAACGAAPTVNVGGPPNERSLRDTVECMPSLPHALVQAVMIGEISNWTTRDIYGLPLAPPAFFAGPYVPSYSRGADGPKVNICRRTAGSGTHAQFMIEYLRTNCINGSPSIKTFANNVPQGVAAPQVYENEGSGGVDQCMNALNSGVGYDGGFTNGITNFPAAPTPLNGGSASVVPLGRTAYGIGYNSLERNSSLGSQYRFVKIDWVEPTLEQAFLGNYRDIYYLSYQNRVIGTDPEPRVGAIRTVAADAGEISVLKAFFALWNSPTPAAVDAVNDGLIVNPDGVAGLNGDEWQGGLLSPSKTAPQVFSGGPTLNDPRTPWARETAGGASDSCQHLSFKN
jgi:hypothetical protein